MQVLGVTQGAELCQAAYPYLLSYYEGTYYGSFSASIDIGLWQAYKNQVNTLQIMTGNAFLCHDMNIFKEVKGNHSILAIIYGRPTNKNEKISHAIVKIAPDFIYASVLHRSLMA